jgi:hypothetical protein
MVTQGSPIRSVRMMTALALSLITAFALSGCARPLFAQTTPATPRDGAHDFDFNIGTWHTHIRRVVDPLSPSSPSIDLNGTVTVRPIWNGKAELEEIEADGPNGHWEGMTLFLYNPESHEWSQTFANNKMGAPDSGNIGYFSDDRVELYGQDTFKDKPIIVRAVWSDITPNGHHYTESYSDDAGRTWHVSFNAELTRSTTDIQGPANVTAGALPFPDPPGDLDPAHAFDWDIGSWKIHMDRLVHPLTGSATWTHMDGTTINSPFWNGRGNIAQVEADGPNGHLELLALRLYNPASHEWTTSFATSGVGVLNTPTGRPIIGSFKDGRGEFIDQEPYNGRMILVRFRIWPVDKDNAQSEQAFSADGGKTWETNWINHYTRTKSN